MEPRQDLSAALDTMLSAATEETYSRITAQIETLTRQRDLIGRLLGKKPIVHRTAKGRRYSLIRPTSMLGKAFLYIGEHGPVPAGEVIKCIGGPSGLYSDLCRCPHVVRVGGGYVLTETGKQWVEKNKEAAS